MFLVLLHLGQLQTYKVWLNFTVNYLFQFREIFHSSWWSCDVKRNHWYFAELWTVLLKSNTRSERTVENCQYILNIFHNTCTLHIFPTLPAFGPNSSQKGFQLPETLNRNNYLYNYLSKNNVALVYVCLTKGHCQISLPTGHLVYYKKDSK